jgi:hypothetical protein
MTTKPVIETDFAELPDGTLLATIEDPSNSARTLLAVYRDQSEAVNLVNFVHLQQNHQHLSFAYGRRCHLLAGSGGCTSSGVA